MTLIIKYHKVTVVFGLESGAQGDEGTGSRITRWSVSCKISWLQIQWSLPSPPDLFVINLRYNPLRMNQADNMWCLFGNRKKLGQFGNWTADEIREKLGEDSRHSGCGVTLHQMVSLQKLKTKFSTKNLKNALIYLLSTAWDCKKAERCGMWFDKN